MEIHSGDSILNWLMGGGLLIIVIFAIRIKDSTEKQINRVYQRLDETKDKAETLYTKKDVCEVTHRAVNDILKDVKQKVDCIPKIKAGIDLLLKKNGLCSEA
ncbi:MAG: hypothetical protein QME65_03960 [Candidatus Omnitrophota bacterium]|nr:hypothetical protein [Candidatus Omnitrophota bacterium]